jgi:hypothetical protein
LITKEWSSNFGLLVLRKLILILKCSTIPDSGSILQTSTLSHISSLQHDWSNTAVLLQHIYGKLKLNTIIEHLTFFYFPFQQKLPLYADYASQMN